MRRFELIEGTSSKFWQIERDGASFTVAYGKIGTAGQAQTKTFPTDAKAEVEHDKLVKEKVAKGYVEVASTGAMPVPKAAPPPASPVASAPAPAIASAPAPAPAAAAPAPSPAPPIPASDEPPRVRLDPAASAHAFRRDGIADVPVDLEASFRAIVAAHGYRSQLWQKGLLRSDAVGLPLLEAALDAIGAPDHEELVAMDLDHAATAALVYELEENAHAYAAGAAIVNLFAATRGIVFALELLLHPLRVKVERERDKSYKVHALWLAEGTQEIVVANQLHVAAGWVALRKRLAHASAADYEAARDVAKAKRTQVTAAVAQGLAYAFPAERWADEDAARVLDETGKEELPKWSWALVTAIQDPALADRYVRKIAGQPYSWIPGEISHALVEGLGTAAVKPLAYLVDRSRDAHPKKTHAEELANIETYDAAFALAHYLEDKALRPIALDLFERIPRTAVRAVAALATSRGRDADGAIALLRAWLGSKKGLVDAVLPSLDARSRAAVEAAREAMGANVPEASMDELPPELSAPLPVQKKPKPMPDFWSPASLPRPLLAGRKKQIPLAAVERIGALLFASTLEEPHPHLELVKAACDPASLMELAWGLFSAWLAASGVAKDGWAFQALGHFGGDEAARRLTPRIREWPGEGGHARAVSGLDVLAKIGSDVALMHLNGVAEKVKFKGLQEKARQKIAEVAAKRGLTPEELADRLVPDLGLDESGTMQLDFGPRSFAVGFDEELKPFVAGSDGKRLGDLPKPNKSDEAEKATAAIEAWKTLKKDARTLAGAQLRRLENAMCSRRKWPVSTFRMVLSDHPLMRHLARRLVWATYSAEGHVIDTFRVAEDGSLSGPDDTPFALALDATVGIPHVLESADLAKKWGPLFGDYELTQPFAQLERGTFSPTEEERKGPVLDRVKGKTTKVGKIIGLDSRGWQHGAPQDAGWIWDYEKDLGGGFVASLGLADGVHAGNRSESPPDQRLESVSLTGNNAKPAWSDIDPIAFSELVTDLMFLID